MGKTPDARLQAASVSSCASRQFTTKRRLHEVASVVDAIWTDADPRPHGRGLGSGTDARRLSRRDGQSGVGGNAAERPDGLHGLEPEYRRSAGAVWIAGTTGINRATENARARTPTSVTKATRAAGTTTNNWTRMFFRSLRVTLGFVCPSRLRP